MAENSNLCEISNDCSVYDPSYLGNGICDEWLYGAFNTEACCWDGGDCNPPSFGDCKVSIECSVIGSGWLGDGICFNYYPYNTEACCWDGGDCDPPEKQEQKQFFGDCKVSAECSVSTLYWHELGDDYCDDYPFNSKECCWDGGDCSTGLSQGSIAAIAIFIVILLCCFSAAFRCAKSSTNNSTSTAQPADTTISAPLTEEEKQSQRRELILMSIIHKKVQSKSSKVPVEQDIVVDLKQAPQAEENIDLPHEEILSLRSLNIILASPVDTVAEQVNGNFDPGDIIIYNDDEENGIVIAPAGDLRCRAGSNSITSGVFGNKNDILVETMRSIRSSLNISIIDESSLYSPKSCPICCDDYAKGDDIAWSKNEQCCHAFHTDCIMQWLMNHDDCPMCRNNYLEGTEDV